MSLTYYRCLWTLLFIPVATLPGQGPLQSTLSGQITVSDSVDPSHLRVQLIDNTQRLVLAEATPSPLGSFDTTPLPNGVHELRVINREGDTVYSTSVSIPYQTTYYLNLANANPRPAGRPISLARMQHKVPKKALQAYLMAKSASEAGDKPTATSRLEQAVRLDPQFFEATNNLGVMYLNSGRLSEAYEMFVRATTIDASDPLAEANLAYVLLGLNRFDEAEVAARASVRADALSSRARFFLAVSLLEQHKERNEAIFHLKKASEAFEPARKLLAYIAIEKKK